MSNFSANIQAILDTSKIPSQIKKIENSTAITLKKFTLDTKGLPSQIQASLDSHNFTINLTGIKTNNLTSQMQSAGNKAGQAFSQSLVNKINTQISTGGIEASIARVQQKFSTLSASVKNMEASSMTGTLHAKMEQIEADLIQLNQLQTQLTSGLQGEALVAAYEKYNKTLLKVRNNLSIVDSSTKQFAKSTDVLALQNKMENWLNTNTRATKTYGNTVQEFIQRLKTLSAQGDVSTADLNELSAAFKRVDQAAESAGLKGKSFGSTIKGAFQSISRYVGVSTLIYAAFNAIKNGIKDVVDLDTALVDLQKTTDANEAQLRKFYYTANETAKALGSTTKEVIQAAADWSRLGYSIKDAQTMAETSSIFASISPGMDISMATDGLVSAMKAFDIEAEDALDGIASKINAIGNTQAVDNQDIVNVLTRSSAAMKEANNTLEETIALGTAATEITRDAEAVGTALKTMSMRIRGYDEETEEYVGGIEELSGEIADLTKTASKPGGISLFTDDSKTEFKSTTQLLRDISEIYDELTDKQQADLLEKLAGKRQGQVVAAILSNFGAVEKSLATMADSAGGAMREMEIIEESLEFKLNALKETATGVFQNLFAKEDMIVVIELLTKLMEVLDFLTEKLGLFGTALTGIAIYAFVKNFD